MQLRSMKWVMLLVLTLLTASCGGGDSTPTDPTPNTTPNTNITTPTIPTTPTTGPVPNGTVTITVVSPTAGTTTNTYTGTYYTPGTTLYAAAVPSPGSNRSTILMNSPTVQLLLVPAGVTPGTYIGDGINLNEMRYVIYDSPTNPTIYYTRECTINLTAVGATGSPWTGSYQGTLQKVAPVADLSNTLQISGTFSVY